MVKKNRVTLFSLRQILLLAFSAIIFCLIFSETTSPLYDRLSGDSATYYIMGWGWAEGKLPYSDLFDQKGPIIYLINAIGYHLTKSVLGVFLIQCISMIFTFLIAWRFLSRLKCNLQRIVSFIIFIPSLIISYGGGNNVEEYLLPFLLLSFYRVYEYIDRCGEDIHNPKWAFLYGFTIAFCYLTRLTNALGLCVAMLFVVFNLIRKRKYRNLLYNAMACLIGFALPVGISFAYFYLHGTFKEMWWATMTFNFEYLNHASFHPENLHQLLFFFIPMLNMFMLLAINIVDIIRKRKIYASFCWLCSILATLWWIYNGNGFTHYCMVALPYYFIIMLRLSEGADYPILNISFDRFIISAFLLVTFLAGTYRGVRLIQGADSKTDYVAVRQDFAALNASIPGSCRQSLCLINLPQEFYIYTGILPDFPFFFNHNFHSAQSPSYIEHLLSALRTSKTKCFIVNPRTDKRVLKILDQRYRFIKRLRGEKLDCKIYILNSFKNY